MAQRYKQFLNLASFSLIIYRRDGICVRNGLGFNAYSLRRLCLQTLSLVPANYMDDYCQPHG